MCSREKPLVKTMAPWSTFIIYKNTKIPFYNFISFILFCNLSYYLPLWDLILANYHRGDWQPPCLHWVQVFAFLCASVANEILYGSPTGLITLVLNWGKYRSLRYCFILSSSRKSQRISQVAATKEVKTLLGVSSNSAALYDKGAPLPYGPSWPIIPFTTWPFKARWY